MKGKIYNSIQFDRFWTNELYRVRTKFRQGNNKSWKGIALKSEVFKDITIIMRIKIKVRISVQNSNKHRKKKSLKIKQVNFKIKINLFALFVF